MATDQPRPTIDELIAQMGESGARICDIDASEAGAGNISLYIGWEIEVRRHFPNCRRDHAPRSRTGARRRNPAGDRFRAALAPDQDEPLSAIGAVRVHANGITGTLCTSNTRRFARLTSEFNSHLAVHQDQVARRGIDFHAVVHAQPPHLTYLSHIPAYRDTARMNAAILRWEPETIVSLSQGIGVLEFMIPGSVEMGAANVAGLREHEIVLWSKHGTMSRSDVSVYRAVDRVEYAETAAHYEYMDIVAGGRAEGLSKAEIRSVADEFGIVSPWL